MPPQFNRNPYGYYSPLGFHNFFYRNRYNQALHSREKYKKKEPMPEHKLQTANIKHNTKHYYDNHNLVFEIFDIKLFFDDVLLISLIFFLYDEGVHDQYLFIALILLLLS